MRIKNSPKTHQNLLSGLGLRVQGLGFRAPGSHPTPKEPSFSELSGMLPGSQKERPRCRSSSWSMEASGFWDFSFFFFPFSGLWGF